ncbi:hypothetical protein [uncultured Friedmanniella sp.]|uniref:hypothetical protein n=1 Tax=uncultured Friedmanniella sp. TaxID=335381 RepID=UPI0035CB8026
MTIRHRTHTAGLAVLLTLALAGCGGSSTDPGTAPSQSPGTSAPGTSTTAPADTITLDITIAGGKVSPSGQKIDAKVGQRVVENITSDVDDEVHAHTGGDGYELEVKAGQPATGGFTLTTPGSFEVESHGTGKIIAILNVR